MHGGAHLMPELPERLGRFTERKLAQGGGVEIRLNTRSRAVDPCGLVLDDGTRIDGATVVCTVGTRPIPLTDALGAEKAQGRVRTAADLSLPGLPRLWSLGDCAAVPNWRDQERLRPPTAQFALRQGPQLAANIARAVRGEATRPFGYRPNGLLSAIGHNKAVARV